jgi:hypothetical protein
MTTAVLMASGVPAKAQVSTWTESVKFGGDLRLRYEMIREEGSDDRDRARFRGRANVSADVTPTVRVVFGLATGGDDPVSTNQTFGDGFTTKDIGVDLAFVEWQFRENLSLTAGKMPKPWFRAGGTTLIWDADLNPEGLVFQYAGKKFFGSTGTFVVQERSDDPESRLNTAQAGINWVFSDVASLSVAASYFDFTNVIGRAPFYGGDPQGNAVDADNNYVFDYDETEIGAQYKTRVGNWPLTVFGDYLLNAAVNREDRAYSFGVIVGESKKPRTMQFSYAWHETGADALNATYNDSDLADGQADARGHYFRARYALSDNIHFSGSFIFSEYGEFSGMAIDFDRIMLDVQFAF